MWKDFFYYSRAERRVIAVLAALVALLVTVLAFRHYSAPEQKKDEALLAFQDSIVKADTIRRRPQKIIHSVQKTSVELFNFDPNRADSSQLIRLGLPTYVVRNVLKYRAKGGVFRTPDALARIYGLSETDFQRIRPYIQIENPVSEPCVKAPVPVQTQEERSVHVRKYAEGTVIDLNQADTASLKRIPGIGAVRAAQIVAYRNRLGGFYSVGQLKEIQGLPIDIQRWFKIEKPLEKSLYINRWNVERLRAHPYLNFYQAKIIVEHRHKYGRLKSISQLALYEEFTEDDLERLKRYVAYD